MYHNFLEQLKALHQVLLPVRKRLLLVFRLDYPKHQIHFKEIEQVQEHLGQVYFLEKDVLNLGQEVYLDHHINQTHYFLQVQLI